VCGGTAASATSKYNRLILLPHPPDAASYLYDYALCHACGVVSARRRPVGRRYAWLLEHFEETLGRVEFGERRAGKVSLSSYRLTEAERQSLRARVAKGVFVSDHSGMSRKEYLPGLLSDRLSNSMHVELLASLVTFTTPPRMVEIRARTGAISAGLQHRFGGEAAAMALFEGQQLVIQEAYGIRATSGIDYEHFTIPFDGTFDLIVANHMFTHAVRPREMLRTLHERLSDGGYLYLFNEPDEREFTEVGKSVFNTLNAFHLQAFDGASLRRALQLNGFDIVFMTMFGGSGSHICLARKRGDNAACTPPTKKSLEIRVQAYRQAQQVAALTMPPFARPRLAESWDELLARSVASGLAEVNRRGNVKVRRSH
jgi:hypothetical protein